VSGDDDATVSHTQAAAEAAGRAHAAAGSRTIEIVAWAIIAFGALVRTRQYLGARSLRYDEARVAYEIAERSFLQMLDPSGFIRVAPPGWFVLEKLSLMTLGTGELSLRLVPFLAGLAALPLFWIVTRRYLGNGAALACVALGAVSEHVVFYTSELKQYSSDVLWCLLLLLVVHPLFTASATKRQWLTAGIVGALAIWFAHPALFVMAALGLVLFVHVLRTRPADLRRTVALGAAWVGSLVLNYILILRLQSGRGELINYWSTGFPPLRNIPRAQLAWLNARLYEYLEIPAGLQSFGLVTFGSAVGFLALLRRNRALAATIALTFALTLLAAVFRQYPFEDRLLLFSVPLLLIVLAAGIDQLNRIDAIRWLRPGMLLLVLLIIHPLVRAVRMVRQPEGREEIKVVVNHAAERMEPTDGMYLNRTSYGAYIWYSTWTDALKNPPERTFLGADIGLGADTTRAEIEYLRRYRRVWMVFVDYYPVDMRRVLEHIEPIAERRDAITAPGAAAYLYEFVERPDTVTGLQQQVPGRP